MYGLMSDADVIQCVFDHIDNKTTDLADRVWREPVASYLSDEHFADELEVFRRLPTVFCPSAALSEPGYYVARSAAGVPIVAVRGGDRKVRAQHDTALEGRGAQQQQECAHHDLFWFAVVGSCD